MEERLTVSVPQAAEALGVGLQAVYKAVREGRLPALRVGTRPKYRIPRRALSELLADPERFNGVARGGREAER